MLSLLLSAAAVVAPPPPPAAVAPPPALTTPAPVAAPPPLPPVDPARIAIARSTSNALFGDGTLARLFDEMLSPAPGGYASAFLDMTMGDMMALAGPAAAKMPTKDGDEMTKLTFRQMLAAKDPYFNQRMAAIHDAVVAEATRLGPKFEAPMREGLAISLARRFTADQLKDMARFFATPSGQALGQQFYGLWMDPAVLKSMFSAIPALSADLPDAMKRVKAASDRFPYPAKPTPPAAAEPTKPATKKPVPKKRTTHH